MENVLLTRIEDLESQISFQDLTVEQLNQTVIQLQTEMLKLREQLSLLSQKLQTAEVTNIASMSEETPPPHY